MTYVSEVTADSPVAWYRMQEASGLIQDSSGNANHATSSTGTATYGQTGPITSEPTDKAISFSGDDSFSIPDHATLDVGDVFTYEAWVKRLDTTATGIGTIATKDGQTPQVRIRYDLGGGIELVKTGVAVVVTSTVAVNDSTTWHHIVVTKNGATVKVYLDGVDRTGAVTNQTMTNTANPLSVGTYGGEFARMLMDEVAIYSTALSAARVSAHYAAAIAAPPAAVERTPTLWVKLAAAANPFDSSPTWTDITADVREVSWSRGRGSTLDEIGPGSGSLRLKNADRHFEPGFAGPYDPLRVYRPINIGVNWGGTDYSLFYGFAEAWNVIWDVNWGTAYAETEVQLVDAIALLNLSRVTTGFGLVESGSVRIGKVLDQATVGFPAAMRSLSSGTNVKTLLQPTTKNCWEHIQECVRSHAADRPCYIDRRGYMMYAGTTASGLTFGDISGELKYTAAQLALTADLIYNRVDVTQEGGGSQTFNDVTSRQRYGGRQFSRSVICNASADTLAVGNYLISQYKDPRTRIEGFQVRPGITTALWNAVVTLDLEHTITVRRRPPGGGTMYSATPKIVGLRWQMQGGEEATVIDYTLSS